MLRFAPLALLLLNNQKQFTAGTFVSAVSFFQEIQYKNSTADTPSAFSEENEKELAYAVI